MKLCKFAAAASVLALAGTGIASAQSEAKHLWPTFAIAAGSYQLSSDDKIRVEGSIERFQRDLDLSKDFGLPERKSLLAGSFEWAFADRHSVGLTTYSLKRSASRSIDRDIEIGGIDFPIGADASLDFKETTIEATYNYWFMRKDRLGFGASFGLVYLSLDATAEASFRFGNSSQQTVARESASTDLPVPMVGFVVKGSPRDWVVLRAGLRYLPSVTIDKWSGEAASYGVAADFYVYGPIAIGVAYSGTLYQADVEDSSWRGSVDLANRGANVYLRASF